MKTVTFGVECELRHHFPVMRCTYACAQMCMWLWPAQPHTSCLFNSQFSTCLTQDIAIKLPFHYHLMKKVNFKRRASRLCASQPDICLLQGFTAYFGYRDVKSVLNPSQTTKLSIVWQFNNGKAVVKCPLNVKKCVNWYFVPLGRHCAHACTLQWIVWSNGHNWFSPVSCIETPSRVTNARPRQILCAPACNSWSPAGTAK